MSEKLKPCPFCGGGSKKVCRPNKLDNYVYLYASIYFYGTLSSRIEIIGNIYDDPELMGGEANG